MKFIKQIFVSCVILSICRITTALKRSKTDAIDVEINALIHIMKEKSFQNSNLKTHQVEISKLFLEISKKYQKISKAFDPLNQDVAKYANQQISEGNEIRLSKYEEIKLVEQKLSNKFKNIQNLIGAYNTSVSDTNNKINHLTEALIKKYSLTEKEMKEFKLIIEELNTKSQGTSDAIIYLVKTAIESFLTRMRHKQIPTKEEK